MQLACFCLSASAGNGCFRSTKRLLLKYVFKELTVCGRWWKVFIPAVTKRRKEKYYGMKKIDGWTPHKHERKSWPAHRKTSAVQNHQVWLSISLSTVCHLLLYAQSKSVAISVSTGWPHSLKASVWLSLKSAASPLSREPDRCAVK